jgi:hypothetical protein
LQRRVGLITPCTKTLTASFGQVPLAALVEIAGEPSPSDHADHCD